TGFHRFEQEGGNPCPSPQIKPCGTPAKVVPVVRFAAICLPTIFYVKGLWKTTINWEPPRWLGGLSRKRTSLVDYRRSRDIGEFVAIQQGQAEVGEGRCRGGVDVPGHWRRQSQGLARPK